MTDAVEIQVRQIAADIFNLPLNSITRETSPESVKNWDSIQQLNFVLALEQSLSITLEPQDIDQIRSVGSAIEVVKAAGSRQ